MARIGLMRYFRNEETKRKFIEEIEKAFIQPKDSKANNFNSAEKTHTEKTRTYEKERD